MGAGDGVAVTRVLGLLLGLLAAACDPNAALCSAAIRYHHDVCAAGDADACEWLHENTLGGVCL